ncbi:MAG: hypothetical protein H0U83_07260 [Sphingomonas sp.]|nr:hypothetical protein [Sphingomonas sp.]
MAHPFRSAIDAAAALILGAAVCFAVASIFQLPLLVAGSIGGLVFVRVFTSLVRLPASPPVLPGFVPAPLEFTGAMLTLGERGDLLLDQPVAAGSLPSPVVRRFRAAPPAGDMPGTNEALPDATEQLREALDQLRRSVR